MAKPRSLHSLKDDVTSNSIQFRQNVDSEIISIKSVSVNT